MFSKKGTRSFMILADTNEVLVHGQRIKLSPKEMGVLPVLEERKDSMVKRVELLEMVWGSMQGNDQGLTQAVSRLRSILSPIRGVSILTIPKKGYQLKTNTNVRLTNQTCGMILGLSMKSLLMLILLAMICLLLFVRRIEIRVDKLSPTKDQSTTLPK